MVRHDLDILRLGLEHFLRVRTRPHHIHARRRPHLLLCHLTRSIVATKEVIEDSL